MVRNHGIEEAQVKLASAAPKSPFIIMPAFVRETSHHVTHWACQAIGLLSAWDTRFSPLFIGRSRDSERDDVLCQLFHLGALGLV
jgi:hypothetical protein